MGRSAGNIFPKREPLDACRIGHHLNAADSPSCRKMFRSWPGAGVARPKSGAPGGLRSLRLL